MSRIAGSGFVIGLGSNQDPERNTATVLQALINTFRCIVVSRIVYTEPVGIHSTQRFVNAVCFVATDWSAEAMKLWCNQLEMQLGRDRTHPQRKLRDRPADLDLLHHCHDVSACTGWHVKETYLAPLVNELLHYVQQRPITAATLSTAYIYVVQQTLGQTPTTIYRDHASSLVRVF